MLQKTRRKNGGARRLISATNTSETPVTLYCPGVTVWLTRKSQIFCKLVWTASASTGLPRDVRKSLVRRLSPRFRRALRRRREVCFRVTVVPMGWRWSVALTQCSHTDLMDRTPARPGPGGVCHLRAKSELHGMKSALILWKSLL